MSNLIGEILLGLSTLYCKVIDLNSRGHRRLHVCHKDFSFVCHKCWYLIVSFIVLIRGLQLWVATSLSLGHDQKIIKLKLKGKKTKKHSKQTISKLFCTACPNNPKLWLWSSTSSTPLTSFDALTFVSVLGRVRFWSWKFGRHYQSLNNLV